MFILSRTNFSFLLISSSASVAGRTAATPSARKRSDSAGPRSWPASPPHAVVAEREPEGASVNERCRVAASVHNAKLIRRHSHTYRHTHTALWPAGIHTGGVPVVEACITRYRPSSAAPPSGARPSFWPSCSPRHRPARPRLRHRPLFASWGSAVFEPVRVAPLQKVCKITARLNSSESQRD